MERQPEVGDTWKHHSGRLYTVLMITNDSVEQTDKYPHTVVYQNAINKTLWSRRLDDWHRSFKYTGSVLDQYELNV